MKCEANTAMLMDDDECLYVPLDGFGPFSIATVVTEIEKIYKIQ